MGTELSPVTTGTVSIDTDGNVTVSGNFWNGALQYDTLEVFGVNLGSGAIGMASAYINADVASPYTSAVVTPWPYGAVSGKTYILRRNSYKRSRADTMFALLDLFTRFMSTAGLATISDTDPPDVEVGQDGQWAVYVNPTTGSVKVFKKVSGAWVEQSLISTYPGDVSIANGHNLKFTNASDSGIILGTASALGDLGRILRVALNGNMKYGSQSGVHRFDDSIDGGGGKVGVNTGAPVATLEARRAGASSTVLSGANPTLGKFYEANTAIVPTYGIYRTETLTDLNGAGAGNATLTAQVLSNNTATATTTSATSNDIGTGSKSWTVGTGLSLTPSTDTIFIWNTADPTKAMYGLITAYNSGTGAITVNVSDTVGSGTGITAWTFRKFTAANPQGNASHAWAKQTGDGDIVGFFAHVEQASPRAGWSGYSYFGLTTISSPMGGGFVLQGGLNNNSHDKTIDSSLWAVGIDLYSQGSYRSSAGMWLRYNGAPFHTGYAALASSVYDTTFLDRSNAITVLKATGSHTDGIDVSGGTFSGKQVKGTGFDFDNAGALTAKSLAIAVAGSSITWTTPASNSGINLGGSATMVKDGTTGALKFTSPTGYAHFSGIGASFEAPVQLASYTVGTVPSAAGWARSLIWVSNESGGATVAYSNGTNWKRVADAANIS